MRAPLITELKARRQSLGWSVADVAERSGVDEKTLADWERGLGSPRLDAADAWAAALGLRLGWAAAGDEGRSGGRIAGVRIDWEARCITVDGAPVRLTPMEWKALERLAKVPGELVTHHELFRHLYGENQPYRAQSTAIRVLITKLRRLLPLRIEARWGRGYVVTGIESPAPAERSGGCAGQPREAAAAQPAPGKDRREGLSLVPDPMPRDAAPGTRDCAESANPGLRLPAPPAPRPAVRRAEELGVIERFLAERGVTRCPDVATIQRSPLPTLVWDKIKRKWVRPPPPGREAS